VLVAGKGHEDYQVIGAQRLAFSDRAVITELLRAQP
jgi:UDP-N-acetylmuramoyl-L-alanyl-D-glutamate--2,6-diaminopimelate ligase